MKGKTVKSNAELLTKLSIGKDLFKPFETDVGTFLMRPLSNGEIEEISALQLKAINVTAEGDIETVKPKDIKVGVDIQELTTLQKEAKYRTIAYSLSGKDDKFTSKDIQDMKVSKKIIDSLYENVLNLSDIQEDVLLPFHKELSRATIKSSSDDRS